MPRKSTSDTESSGDSSPDPPESSPSPELTCEERDPSDNREPSADPTIQEKAEPSADPTNQERTEPPADHTLQKRTESSGGHKEEAASAALDVVSEECSLKLNEPLWEGSKVSRENPDAEKASKSAASDTSSTDSICPKCGKSKRKRETDLKPRQSFCECFLEEDEKDTENVTLQERPLVDVATVESSQLETFRDQNPDFREREPPEDDSNKDQRVENQLPRRRTLDLEGCVPDCPDISCRNCHWRTTLVIVGTITAIFVAFVYLIIREILKKQAQKNPGISQEFFEKDFDDIK